MRKEFSQILYFMMQKDESIYVLCGDVGYGVMDDILKDFPNRAFNCGASEQAMLDIAVGLALSGKIPVVYTITPFLLYRPFEAIRLYLDQEKIPVKLVGSGRNKDYFYIGITHFSDDDKKVMRLFKNIKSYWPSNKDTIANLVGEVLYNNSPSYLNLTR
jgi:transketolase